MCSQSNQNNQRADIFVISDSDLAIYVHLLVLFNCLCYNIPS